VKYILILWIAGYPPFTAVEFDSQKACVAAGETVGQKRDAPHFKFVCVPKGDAK
jgi:hypothetical protein